MRIILMFILILFSLTAQAEEKIIEVTGYFDCNFDELIRTSEGEKYNYYEGNVEKVKNSKAIVNVEKNSKNFKFIFQNNCNKDICLKKHTYIRFFMDPESNKACINIKGRLR